MSVAPDRGYRGYRPKARYQVYTALHTTTQAPSHVLGPDHLALDDENNGRVEARQAKTSSVHPATAALGLGGGIWSMPNPAEFCPPPTSFVSSYLNHTAADFRLAASSFDASFHLYHTAAKTSCSTFSGSDPLYVSNKAQRDNNYAHNAPPMFPLSSYLEGNFASPTPDDMLYVPHSKVMVPPASQATRKHKPNAITTRILLPALFVGCIIGRGGDVIKAIRDFSGAYITILESGSDNRNSKFRLVTLVGPLEAVGTGIQMIGLQAGLFDDHNQVPSGGNLLPNHHPPMAPHSFLPSSPTRVSQPLYNRGAGQEREAETVGASGAGEEDMDAGIRMIIDAGIVGQLMGRRGWRVHAIRMQTGVRRIQVLGASESQQEGSIRNERVVVILGTAEQCRRAHQDITLILEVDPVRLQHCEQVGGLGDQDCVSGRSVVGLGLEGAISLMEGLGSFQCMSLLDQQKEEKYVNGQNKVGAGWNRMGHTHAAGEKQEKDEGNEEDKGHDELSETTSGLIPPKAKIVGTAKSLGGGATAAGDVSRVATRDSEIFSAPAMSAALLSSVPLAKTTTNKGPASATAALSPSSFVSLPPPPRPLSASSSSTSSFSSPAPSVDEYASTSVESLDAADAKKSFREFSTEVVVRISNENIGRLIGKEGSTNRRLRHESQCRIEIDDYRHPADSTMREVRLKGHIQQVHVAAAMVAHQLFGPEDGGGWY